MTPSDLTSPFCSATATAIVSAWTSKPTNFTLFIDRLLSLVALYCRSSDSQHNPRLRIGAGHSIVTKSSPRLNSNGGTMCVKVFLADDADVMRKAIRSMLSNREDISVVGEASDFYETIRKTAELHPDLIILDVNMPDRNRIAPSDVRSLLNGAKVLAITLGADDVADELLDSVGAVKVLDKMDLADQLIPVILELAPVGTTQPN